MVFACIPPECGSKFRSRDSSSYVNYERLFPRSDLCIEAPLPVPMVYPTASMRSVHQDDTIIAATTHIEREEHLT